MSLKKLTDQLDVLSKENIKLKKGYDIMSKKYHTLLKNQELKDVRNVDLKHVGEKFSEKIDNSKKDKPLKKIDDVLLESENLSKSYEEFSEKNIETMLENSDLDYKDPNSRYNDIQLAIIEILVINYKKTYESMENFPLVNSTEFELELGDLLIKKIEELFETKLKRTIHFDKMIANSLNVVDLMKENIYKVSFVNQIGEFHSEFHKIINFVQIKKIIIPGLRVDDFILIKAWVEV